MIKKLFVIALLAVAAFAVLSQIPSVATTAQARPTPGAPPIATPASDPTPISSN